jgi:hypothetical protein
MAFSVPDFNTDCDIYTGPWNTRVLRIAGQECNLQYGRRPASHADFPVSNEFSVCMNLLLPAGTDIRSTVCGYIADSVECPAGSGRWYFVANVDDVGKSYPNEFRVALLLAASEAKFGTGSEYLGLFWPTPIP